MREGIIFDGFLFFEKIMRGGWEGGGAPCRSPTLLRETLPPWMA